jgi:hypothetical protein
VEVTPLSVVEAAEKNVDECLAYLCYEEEINWSQPQQEKVRHIEEGG